MKIQRKYSNPSEIGYVIYSLNFAANLENVASLSAPLNYNKRVCLIYFDISFYQKAKTARRALTAQLMQLMVLPSSAVRRSEFFINIYIIIYYQLQIIVQLSSIDKYQLQYVHCTFVSSEF